MDALNEQTFAMTLSNFTQIKTITINVLFDVGVLSFGLSKGRASGFDLLEPLSELSLDWKSSCLFWNQL